MQTLRLMGLYVPKIRHPCVLEESLPSVLQRIESSLFETTELCFTLTPDADLQGIDWRQLERVWLPLHFFGMRTVRIFVDVISGDEAKNEGGVDVEGAIYQAMPELYSRGVLMVHATMKRKEDKQRYA